MRTVRIIIAERRKVLEASDFMFNDRSICLEAYKEAKDILFKKYREDRGR